ncbi:SdpI family protein [Nonlabens sp. SCSIO 43208]|uniref:SdpI family protein n=1 Tax=Nonlabens sp. SCSIO 43208 TaxID=2793009 RepID=UPI003D6B80F5
MQNKNFIEYLIITLNLIPFLYLGFIYSELPEEVAMHFNSSGQVDRMGSKQELWILPILLCGVMYFLFKYLPQLDPKNNNSRIWPGLRLGLTVFMSTISIIIIYACSHTDSSTFSKELPRLIFAGVGLLFVLLGLYMRHIKPNYFIGIRTPWTLENNDVWKKTHYYGGYWFLIAGIVMVISSILFSMQTTFIIVMSATIGIAIASFAYSYYLYQKPGKS